MWALPICTSRLALCKIIARRPPVRLRPVCRKNFEGVMKSVKIVVLLSLLAKSTLLNATSLTNIIVEKKKCELKSRLF